jgi:nucleotide-binding universal stress UspA family protein
MTVVVGYVPTGEGEAALTAAADEARRRGTGIVVVSSTKGESHVDPTYRQTSALAHLAAGLRSEGLHVDVRYTRGGDPADAIVSAAQEVDAELVVVGLRRRSPIGKVLLGSTAQSVLLHAPCSVLAVRAPGGR